MIFLLKSWRYSLLLAGLVALLALPVVAEDTVDHDADMQRTLMLDQRLFNAAEGKMVVEKVRINSTVDNLQIPAYVFKPPQSKGKRQHAALVWVYGGIHDYFGINYFPFILEAVEQGYVVIAPEYRGASGYGKAYYNALDYGGYEVNDAVFAAEYLKNDVDIVDPKRIGIIGWSHGGLITLLAVTREAPALFKTAVAFVPVSNLIFRMAHKGPEYQKTFIDQPRIGGLPHEVPEIYIDRSPLFHVDKLQIPALVMVATNDDDADFVETEALIHALKVKKPKLATTVVLDNPTGGHYFNRRVDMDTLQRNDSPEQIKAWKQTWAFLALHLIE